MYKTTTIWFGRAVLKPDKSQIVAAYKQPIVETFFYPSIYIYARGSPRKFNRGSKRVNIQTKLRLISKQS